MYSKLPCKGDFRIIFSLSFFTTISKNYFKASSDSEAQNLPVELLSLLLLSLRLFGPLVGLLIGPLIRFLIGFLIEVLIIGLIRLLVGWLRRPGLGRARALCWATGAKAHTTASKLMQSAEAYLQ